MVIRKSVSSVAISLAAVVLLSLGCKKEQIRVYTAPKDTVPQQRAETESGPAPSRPRPQLSYKTPAHWKEVPASEISLVSFKVEGAKGEEANVSVTQLTNLKGKDAEIVNMWRQQVGLEALSRDEALKQFQPVQVAGHKGNLFEISSKSEPLKIVTAVVHDPGGSWFYKLSGDIAVVDKEKQTFLDFLQTIQVKEVAQVHAADESHDDRFHWNVPPSWKAAAPKQMQVARFQVPEQGNASAEVSVSVFPGDTGGTLANLNRWRKQLQLKEVNESEVSSLVKPLDPALPGSILVDMTNNDKRMVGAIVPRGEQYWFYKLMGAPAAVAPEKDAFIGFAKSKPE
jgi:hypothetical protein